MRKPYAYEECRGGVARDAAERPDPIAEVGP